MARHEATGEVIIGAVDNELVGDPLDQTEKDRLTDACQTAGAAALTTADFTEAAGSLVVSVEDPASGPDSILLWFHYDHDSTEYRVKAPIAPGMAVIVGYAD